MKRYQDHDWLVEQYVKQGKSTTEIGAIEGVHRDTILYWLKAHNIPRRTAGRSRMLSATRRAQEMKPILVEMYIKQEMTVLKIAEALDLSASQVLWCMERVGIERRDRTCGFYQCTGKPHPHLGKRGPLSYMWRRKASQKSRDKRSRTMKRIAKRGKEHHAWQGGKTRHSSGYILVKKHEHPLANIHGYVFEHHLVMEQKIGRPLTREEVVHHINGFKDDNRPSNLLLLPNTGAHTRLHAMLRRAECECDDTYRTTGTGS